MIEITWTADEYGLIAERIEYGPLSIITWNDCVCMCVYIYIFQKLILLFTLYLAFKSFFPNTF